MFVWTEESAAFWADSAAYTHSYDLLAARDLARDGYTVLLSTHDPQHALWFADRALALHRGRILAYGAPREVVTADLLQQLYGRRIALIDTAQGPVVVPQEGD